MAVDSGLALLLFVPVLWTLWLWVLQISGVVNIAKS